MPAIDTVIDRFRLELLEDYVGLWQIFRDVEETAPRTPSTTTDKIVAVANALLDDDRVAIGQFRGQSFEEWPGSRAEKMNRLRAELTELGRPPDIGDIAWLVRR